MHRRRFLAILLTLMGYVLLTGAADAQPRSSTQHNLLRIGVLVPGSGSGTGLNERLAARAWDQLMRSSGRGIAVELLFRDGGTTAGDTAGNLRELVDVEGVHAVVCCTTPESLEAAEPFADSLPILALSRPTTEPAGAEGPLLMPPRPLAIARAVTRSAVSFGQGIALLTSDDDHGSVRDAAVRAGALEAGIPLAESARYIPGAEVFTPEALLVAASGAGSVLAWPLPGDLADVLEALDARGWEGPVYAPLELARELPGGLRNGRLRGVLVPVPPVLLENVPTAERQNGPAVYRFEQALRQTYGRYSPSFEGAMTFDALDLVLRGAEQALTYGVSAAAVGSFRQALQDGLVAQGVLTGAAGTYRFDGNSRDLALAQGVAMARLENGRLVPVDR